MSVQEEQATLLGFFDFLFGKDQGYVVIATTLPPARRDTFKERYFEWPAKRQEMVDFIEKVTPTHNVYFCVNVMSVEKRKKANAIPQNLVWADLDPCHPSQLDIPPQCVIESSPNRYQAIWRLDRKIDPYLAENYGKRLAYYYSGFGVDKSGHDLTQLLRVPTTYNFKYQMDDAPRVELVSLLEDLLPTDVFDALPPIDDAIDLPDFEVPNIDDQPSPEAIIHRYQEKLRPTAFARYYSEEPPKDWSKYLWRLINTCIEVGMTAEETFVIGKTSKCNKYERDGRPEAHLWKEVLKAELEHKNIEVLLQDHRVLQIPALISVAEEASLPKTVIDEYMNWATEATDAAPEYHELCCTILLSSIMATTLRLQTTNRKIYPNIWGLVLGDSTLTRKTTSMDMAMDFLYEVNRDLILASDASSEGLMTALSLRPKMVSVFYRDEVTGFFDAINHKQYLRDMPEIMTKMYDVPMYMTRMLQKNTYMVTEPIFIFFGGGIKERTYALAEEQYFTSGFLPRFLVVSASGDTERIRPTGPPRKLDTGKRFELLQTFQALHEMYTNQAVTIDDGSGNIMKTTPEIEVVLPDKVWERAAIMEKQLLDAAADSPEAMKSLPTFSRMYFSLLKMTMLFCAARQEPKDNTLMASMDDLLCAAWYIQKWGKHSVDFITNSGVSGDETKVRSVYRTVERIPGIMRSQIMQRHRLNAREMSLIEDTLVQRMMLHITHEKGKKYWPLGK